MNKDQNIFTRLKNHCVMPPEEIAEAVHNEIKREYLNLKQRSSLGNLQNFEISPPVELISQIFNEVNNEHFFSRFATLKDIEITPPDHLKKTLFKRKEITGSQKNTTAVIRSLMFQYRAVAAILIAITGTILLINQFRTLFSSATFIQDHSPAVSSAQPHKQDTALLLPEKNLLVKKRPASRKTITSPEQDNYLYISSVNIDGNSLQIKDNDFLYTFTSYRYKNVPEYFRRKEETGLLITIDQYTSISLSAYMTKNISDIYKTTIRGRPTRKARKAKARIKKWKQMDTRQFDKNLMNNPLDIIDLSDFIFKN